MTIQSSSTHQTIQFRVYFEAIAINILSGAIASGLGWAVILLWDSKPLYVFLVAALIVLITLGIAARTIISRHPSIKFIWYLILITLLVSEGFITWLFSTQITRVPDLVGLNSSEIHYLAEQANLVDKISTASCGDQNNNITFQDLPSDSLVMKGSKVQVVTVIPIIEILSPSNSTSVSWKEVVSGQSCGVANSGLYIYVIIHPLESNIWWVQPPAIVDTDGQWRATCQFGEDQNQGTGAKYEIIAIVTSELSVGKSGMELPRHLAHSQVVTAYKDR